MTNTGRAGSEPSWPFWLTLSSGRLSDRSAAEEQFRAMGRRDAKDLALDLLAAYQGAAVLTAALGQAELMTRQSKRLRRWIDDKGEDR